MDGWLDQESLFALIGILVHCDLREAGQDALALVPFSLRRWG